MNYGIIRNLAIYLSRVHRDIRLLVSPNIVKLSFVMIFAYYTGLNSI